MTNFLKSRVYNGFNLFKEEVEMDRNKENGINFFDEVKIAFRDGANKRKRNGILLFEDILIFSVAFLFARCHFGFGVYPFAIAFVAMLRSGVWIALSGAVIGALSLGESGIIYAIISLISAFLRVIVSGGSGTKRLFSESLALRVCSAGIGSLVGGIYQVLLGGFGAPSVLFGVMGISLSCGFTIVFSGIYLGKISMKKILFSKAPLLSRKNFDSDKEKFDLILYQCSLLVFIFLIGFSLANYEFLGISLAYIYSVLLTLFVAKRFGVTRATVVGFVSSLSVNGIYAVSFALVGLGAGALFTVGAPYAIIAGGILLLFFSYYVGSLNGIVSTFPEYMCGAILALPILRGFSKEKVEELERDEVDLSERMVNVAALSYKNKGAKLSENIAFKTIKSLSQVVKSAGANEGKVGYEEYRDAVVFAVREHCLSCPSYKECIEESPAPCAENIDLIAEKLTNGERVFIDDIDLFPTYCAHVKELFDKIMESASRLENQSQRNRRMDIRAKDFELVSKMLEENFSYYDEKTAVDLKIGKEVEKILLDFGIGSPSVKIFGERKKHIICAGIDIGGKISTSKELKAEIEKLLCFSLSDGEFYKKDKYILFEYDEIPSFKCDFAFSTSVKCNENVNGDTLASFESEDGKFYALLSDGEGSGQRARDVSGLSCDYLSRILNLGISKTTALQGLNHILRFRENEKSATVDLFELDIYTGEAVFYKCGATSSYIKRDGSIFRVRSQSAPLGMMPTIDAERIRVDVKHGDYVVLLSDGALAENEDTTWLIELINRERVDDIKQYSELILKRAKEKTGNRDDMSVAVIKIRKTA